MPESSTFPPGKRQALLHPADMVGMRVGCDQEIDVGNPEVLRSLTTRSPWSTSPASIRMTLSLKRMTEESPCPTSRKYARRSPCVGSAGDEPCGPCRESAHPAEKMPAIRSRIIQNGQDCPYGDGDRIRDSPYADCARRTRSCAACRCSGKDLLLARDFPVEHQHPAVADGRLDRPAAAGVHEVGGCVVQGRVAGSAGADKDDIRRCAGNKRPGGKTESLCTVCGCHGRAPRAQAGGPGCSRRTSGAGRRSLPLRTCRGCCSRRTRPCRGRHLHPLLSASGTAWPGWWQASCCSRGCAMQKPPASRGACIPPHRASSSGRQLSGG